MSWDDEDFDIPSTSKHAAASWEEEANDEPLLDSWDIDEEEVARKKKEEEAKKKAEKEALKKRQEEAKAKKLAKNKGEKALLDIDLVDEDTRQELLKKAQLEADLNNAADLFGGLGVADDGEIDINEHPRERAAKAAAAAAASAPRPARLTKDTPIETHPLFQPTDRQEYERLRKSLGPVLTNLAEDSLMNYTSGLAIDLIRDLAQPLSIESIRKVISTLNVILKEKEKAERQARLKKAGGTATGGAGKKKAKPAVKTNVNSSFKKDVFEDMDESKYDQFEDDDFM
ncbi:Eukaryotic translation initiation factor 3 subunit J [Debaryomyces fabryi]|uniref:Eukaryotic translation initiation factor 3 subunit J n=1 Tax=Debaryomyces fabryi TaxID=58627 RepID=A0A0V1Q6A7_9ASCO|nr:Eukaryotic translation initiation factor 3 subunit J [Debaryomyces fabryi]KSA04046.1 Eukaryotic translation initiation factor 3 subunit J [Debaryomyces fabryi]CUM50273.1 unnamed protein product [Debaryomyces fabryi]